jgi:prepilin-type processing-associated H-X9-DG protein
LSKAKQASQNIACLNNVKQITLAYQIYAADFNESYPNTPDKPNHNFQLAQGTISGTRYGGDSVGGYSDWGLLYEAGILRDGHIAYCPRYNGRNYANWNLPDKLPGTATTYYSRNWIKSDQPGVEIHDTAGTSVANYGSSSPSKLAQNLQYNRRSLISDVIHRSWTQTHGYLHDVGSNVGFVDGSAQLIQWGGNYKPTEVNNYVPWWGQEGRMFPEVFDRRAN